MCVNLFTRYLNAVEARNDLSFLIEYFSFIKWDRKTNQSRRLQFILQRSRLISVNSQVDYTEGSSLSTRRDWMSATELFFGNATVQCNEQSLETCVRQVGLLSTAGVDSWGDLTLVREDRVEPTSGLSAVPPGASQSSYVGNG